LSFARLKHLVACPPIQRSIISVLLAAGLAAVACTASAAAGEAAAGSSPEIRRSPDQETSTVSQATGTPDIIGVYLSHGYWQPMEIEELMADLESLGVNTVIDYALTSPEDSHWQWGFESYLASAQRHGIGVVFYLGALLDGTTPVDSGGYLERVTSTVAALKHHPQITAWYVHDEVLPMVRDDLATVQYVVSLEQMRALYQAIHAEDPTRPQLNVWSQLPDYAQFGLIFNESHTPFGRPAWMADQDAFEAAMRAMMQDTCDWVLVDSYPFGAQWRDHDKQPELAFVDDITARANSLRAPRQPLLLVFQSFSWAQYGQATWLDAPLPTYAEMRDTLHIAADNGASGAIAYSWFDLTRNIAGRDLPGRDRCLSDLRRVLKLLSSRGWPAGNGSLPFENTSNW